MIVIIDSGVGNVGSIANMLRKVGAEPMVSRDPGVIDRAEKLILPGVGAFDEGMSVLQRHGLVEVLTERVLRAGVPILGLCLGMQLLTRGSEEGRLPGLAWLDARTVRFRFSAGEGGLRVPHMGWNEVRPCRSHPLLAGLDGEARFYFAHSYHVECADRALVLGETGYGRPFASAISRDNIMGLQFHPEKSHRFGLTVLKNFAERV